MSMYGHKVTKTDARDWAQGKPHSAVVKYWKQCPHCVHMQEKIMDAEGIKPDDPFFEDAWNAYRARSYDGGNVMYVEKQEATQAAQPPYYPHVQLYSNGREQKTVMDKQTGQRREPGVEDVYKLVKRDRQQGLV